MKRHHVIVVLILSLLVPQLATALPRPDATQSEPEQNLGQVTVNANDPVGVQTPIVLQQGKSYRLEVRGTWKPTTSISNQADAAYETTNGSTWTQTGKGLIVASTNYGSPANPTTFRSNHVYSFTFSGRGVAESLRINDPNGYGDNSGSLTVTVFGLTNVTYTYRFTHFVDFQIPALPSVVLDFTSVSQTVTITESTTTVTAALPGNDQLPVPVPYLATLGIEFKDDPGCGGKRATLKVDILNVPQPLQSGITPAQCFPTAFGLGVLYPTTSTVIGGDGMKERPLFPPIAIGPIQGQSTCLAFVFVGALLAARDSQNCRIVLDYRPNPTPLPLIPPGSRIDVTIGWNADTSKLWRTPVNDGEGFTEAWGPFNPFNPSHQTWFAQQVQASAIPVANSMSPLNPVDQPCPLCLSIHVVIKGPDGGYIGGTGPVPWKVPALGQLVEALFTAKVNGQ